MAETQQALRPDEPIIPQDPGQALLLWRRFRKNKAAILGALVVLVMILAALFARQVAPYDPLKPDYQSALQGPSSTHWFGTDELGRDLFSRVIYGARVSLTAGVISVGLALAIGLPIGLLSGYYRGFWDEMVIMRITDAFQAIPFLILALAIAAALGPGLSKAMIAIGIGLTPGVIRMVRGQVLAHRESEYVQAVRALGASDARIMFRHILPNIAGPVIVQASLACASAIIAESSLSYLGLGVQPPTPAWGSALRAGQGYLTIAPWLSYAPGAAVFISVLSINLMGDGLRDMLDPRMKNS